MGERLLLKLSEDYRSLISQDSEQRWLLQLTDFPSSSFPNSRPPPPHHRNQDRRRGRGKPFPDKKSSAFHGDGEVDGPPTDGFGSFFSSQKKGGREEGTRGDVLSALSLLIQQQPLCALALLHRLLNLIGKKRRGAQMLGRKKKMGRGATTTGGRSHAALEVAFDLFQGHLILPAFRKLRLIQDQPAWLRSKVVELLLSFEDRHTGSGDARGGGEREGENKRRGGEEEAEEGKGEDLEEKKMKDGGEAKDTKMKGGRGRGKGGDNEGQKRSQAMVIPLLQLSMLWRLEVELKMIYAAFVDVSKQKERSIWAAETLRVISYSLRVSVLSLPLSRILPGFSLSSLGAAVLFQTCMGAYTLGLIELQTPGAMRLISLFLFVLSCLRCLPLSRYLFRCIPLYVCV